MEAASNVYKANLRVYTKWKLAVKQNTRKYFASPISYKGGTDAALKCLQNKLASLREAETSGKKNTGRYFSFPISLNGGFENLNHHVLSTTNV